MSEPAPRATESAARQVLALCIRSRWEPGALQTLTDLVSRDGSAWQAVGRLPGKGPLIPLLYDTVRGEGLVPAPIEEEWREVYYHSLLRSTRFFHQVTRVLRALKDVDCPVVVLKGAALAETVYGDGALRPMVDVDLLVPPSGVRAAEAVLTRLGYVPQLADPWPGFSQRYQNSMAYLHPSGRPLPWMVGLHWHLFDVPYYRRIRPEGWFGRAQPARVAGVDTLVPSPEDHLVYLCGHLALHHQYNSDLLR